MVAKTFEAGTVLRDIHLLEFIGHLCDYEVWHGARVSPSGSITRITVKFAGSGSRSDADARLARELRLAGPLAHPNILRILDLRRLRALDMLLTEPITGPSVADLRASAERRRQRIPMAATLELLEQVARALAHAWRAADAAGRPLAIASRCLTPNRIFVGHGGVAALMDFSSAWTSADPGPVVPEPNLDEARYRAPELHDRPQTGGRWLRPVRVWGHGPRAHLRARLRGGADPRGRSAGRGGAVG